MADAHRRARRAAPAPTGRTVEAGAARSPLAAGPADGHVRAGRRPRALDRRALDRRRVRGRTGEPRARGGPRRRRRRSPRPPPSRRDVIVVAEEAGQGLLPADAGVARLARPARRGGPAPRGRGASASSSSWPAAADRAGRRTRRGAGRRSCAATATLRPPGRRRPRGQRPRRRAARRGCARRSRRRCDARRAAYPDERRRGRRARRRCTAATPDEIVPTNGAAQALWLLPAALRPALAACVHPASPRARPRCARTACRSTRVLRDPERGFALDPARGARTRPTWSLVGNPASPSRHARPRRGDPRPAPAGARSSSSTRRSWTSCPASRGASCASAATTSSSCAASPSRSRSPGCAPATRSRRRRWPSACAPCARRGRSTRSPSPRSTPRRGGRTRSRRPPSAPQPSARTSPRRLARHRARAHLARERELLPRRGARRPARRRRAARRAASPSGRRPRSRASGPATCASRARDAGRERPARRAPSPRRWRHVRDRGRRHRRRRLGRARRARARSGRCAADDDRRLRAPARLLPARPRRAARLALADRPAARRARRGRAAGAVVRAGQRRPDAARHRRDARAPRRARAPGRASAPFRLRARLRPARLAGGRRRARQRRRPPARGRRARCCSRDAASSPTSPAATARPGSRRVVLVERGFGAEPLRRPRAARRRAASGSIESDRAGVGRRRRPIRSTPSRSSAARRGARSSSRARPGCPTPRTRATASSRSGAARAVTLAALAPAPGRAAVGRRRRQRLDRDRVAARRAAGARGGDRGAAPTARSGSGRNALRLGVPALDGRARARRRQALAGLEPPDAIFVGGGVSAPGLLDACWAALRPGGRIVANAVTLEGEQALHAARAARGGDAPAPRGQPRRARSASFEAWRPQLPVVQWSADPVTVHFIGAGPGAPDLLTLRAQRLIAASPVCLYAGALVPPEVLAHAPAGRARRRHAAPRPRPDRRRARGAPTSAARTSRACTPGDLSIYSAAAEQMRRLDALGIPWDVTPGVPAFAAAAAALRRELTVPGVAQTVVLTRYGRRASPMPAGEDLAGLAAHGATLVDPPRRAGDRRDRRDARAALRRRTARPPSSRARAGPTRSVLRGTLGDDRRRRARRGDPPDRHHPRRPGARRGGLPRQPPLLGRARAAQQVGVHDPALALARLAPQRAGSRPPTSPTRPGDEDLVRRARRTRPSRCRRPRRRSARTRSRRRASRARRRRPRASPRASRRPVVIWTAPPTRLNGTRWRAASACGLLMPGMTSCSNATAPAREDLVDDGDRAVVERRVAPDEQRAAAVVAELARDRALPDVRAPGARQSLDRGPVARRPRGRAAGRAATTRRAAGSTIAREDLLRAARRGRRPPPPSRPRRRRRPR